MTTTIKFLFAAILLVVSEASGQELSSVASIALPTPEDANYAIIGPEDGLGVAKAARPDDWDPEFHDPGKALVLPTLQHAQICLSYAVQLATGTDEDRAPAMDEFCAVRGLYLIPKDRF